MTMPDRDDRPIRVEIGNFPAKKRKVLGTTGRTYVLDVAGRIQLGDYEPTRVRMTVRPIDAAVALTFETPVVTPDVSSPTVAPQGLYLAPNPTGHAETFYGPDAVWINSLGTATRVTVVKEYC